MGQEVCAAVEQGFVRGARRRAAFRRNACLPPACTVTTKLRPRNMSSSSRFSRLGMLLSVDDALGDDEEVVAVVVHLRRVDAAVRAVVDSEGMEFEDFVQQVAGVGMLRREAEPEQAVPGPQGCFELGMGETGADRRVRRVVEAPRRRFVMAHASKYGMRSHSEAELTGVQHARRVQYGLDAP